MSNLNSNDFPTIVLRMEDGSIHLRMDPRHIEAAVRILTDAGIPCDPTIEHDDGGVIVTTGIRFPADTDPAAVGDALRAELGSVQVYDHHHDAEAPGPLVRWRRMDQPSDGGRPFQIYMLDLGFESGAWVFGPHLPVENARYVAKEAGIPVEYEDWNTDGGERWLGCFCVHSQDFEALHGALVDDGMGLNAEIFRPANWFDLGENS